MLEIEQALVQKLIDKRIKSSSRTTQAEDVESQEL